MSDDRLQAIWERHLGDVVEGLGFLDQGGHSLMAVRLAADLHREADVVVPVAAFLRDNLTLAGIRDMASRPGGSATHPATASAAPRRARVQPLVVAQRAIWMDQQLKANRNAYAVAGALAVEGRVDVDALVVATAGLIERHDALRAHAETFATGPALVFGRSAGQVAVRRLAAPTELSEAVDLLAGEIDTTTAPLWRLGVLTQEQGDVVIAVLDHLVADAEALDVLLADLADAYALVTAGGPGRALKQPTQKPAPSFAAFLAERREQEHEGHAAALAHWRGVLGRVDLASRLPYTRGAEQRAAAPRVARRRIDGARTAHLEAGLRNQRATIAAALVCAVAGPLGRAIGQEQCLLAVPTSQRSTGATVDLVGMALGVLPVVVPTHGSSGARLAAARDALLDGQQFTTVGVAEAVRASGGLFDPASPPLQAWVNDLTGRDAPEGFGAPTRYVDHELARPLFPLSFYLHRVNDQLELVALTDGDLFDDRGYLDALCDQVVAELEALAEGTSARRATLPELAPVQGLDPLAILDRAPGPSSVRGPGTTWRPEDVRLLADEARDRWIEIGAAAGDVVLVRASRNVHLLPALLGAWRAGLVPAVVDARLPEAGVQQRAAAAGARWQTGTTADAQPAALPCHLPAGSQARTTNEAEPSHILFTSGTTGDPKPVTMSLAATLGAVADYIDVLRPGQHDRIGLTSGLGHDPMLRDLLVPHLTGAQLRVPDDGDIRDPRALAAFVTDHRLTVLHATPGLLELLLAGETEGLALSGLRAIVCGGEPLDAPLLGRLVVALPGVRVHNAYGCTESAQIASLLDVTDVVVGGAHLPVGTRCGATGVHVVTDDGLALPGELGEVVIVGPYVTPGAKGRHRTGDRGRLDTAGRVHLDGRLDRQLSIGGYRIAPEAIEAVALATPGVEHAWAGPSSAAPGTLTLAVTPSGVDDPRTEVARRLRLHLARHEVPGRILLVRDFELDDHHKRVGPGRLIEDPRPDPARQLVPELQGRVLDVIQRTVGVDVLPRQNFFDAGLRSLQLLQLHRTLQEELGIVLSPIALFEHPNVQALVRAIDAPSDELGVPYPGTRSRRSSQRHGAAGRSARRVDLYADVDMEEESRG